MPKGAPIARVGDRTSHGGIIVSGHPVVKVNGKPKARVGDKVTCPKCGDNAIATGVEAVSGDGPLVAVVGSKTECGATIVSGSPDTFAAKPVEHHVAPYSGAFKLTDETTGEPIVGMPYVIREGNEIVAMGRTAHDGRTKRVFAETEGKLELFIGLPAYLVIEELQTGKNSNPDSA